ncbi:hypothetical protein QJS10_CPB13g01328 [Acorus calamus]|uniref:Tuftelin interacting protein N-terminal domain-containing protein n=1 Tax=Acorus calamus TaxID=4465 RepID=A0AAV9DGU2_ACOCL|nr:hypothetical protein QJS10_CPB13g01328 [Acorus calamus]
MMTSKMSSRLTEKRRQTKDDPLYGIFVRSSFDDEDRRSGKHGRCGRQDLDDDLPKSASTFVSSGTVDQLDPPPLDQPVQTADHDTRAVEPQSNMLEERRTAPSSHFVFGCAYGQLIAKVGGLFVKSASATGWPGPLKHGSSLDLGPQPNKQAPALQV